MHSTKMISIRNPENHGSNLNQDAGSISFIYVFSRNISWKLRMQMNRNERLTLFGWLVKAR